MQMSVRMMERALKRRGKRAHVGARRRGGWWGDGVRGGGDEKYGHVDRLSEAARAR